MANNTSTLTPDALRQMILEVTSQAVADLASKSLPNPFVKADAKSDKQKIEVLVVKAFRRCGYGDVVPRADVMTYRKWLESGYRVKPGEKAVKVKQFRLFHKSQVEPVEAVQPMPKVAEPKASKVTQLKPAKGKSDQPSLGV
jgi:hypothetical protein